MNHPIFVDMDDVISETTRSYPALVEREFGIHTSYEEITSFDLSTSFGLSQAQLTHLFKVVHSEAVLMQLMPVPGVREVLTEWHDRGYPIAVVTGRPPETRDLSLAWLEEKKIPFNHFDICDKYGRHHNSPDSFISLKELQHRPYTLAVEDSLSMGTFLSGTMKVPTFLYNRPWNQNGMRDPFYTRCASWQEITQEAASLLCL